MWRQIHRSNFAEVRRDTCLLALSFSGDGSIALRRCGFGTRFCGLQLLVRKGLSRCKPCPYIELFDPSPTLLAGCSRLDNLLCFYCRTAPPRVRCGVLTSCKN